jgi:hypothetical protein
MQFLKNEIFAYPRRHFFSFGWHKMDGNLFSSFSLRRFVHAFLPVFLKACGLLTDRPLLVRAGQETVHSLANEFWMGIMTASI